MFPCSKRFTIHNSRLMSNLKSDENGKTYYQGFPLKHFKRATHSVQERYLSSVVNICTNVKEKSVTSKSQQSSKIFNLYWILSLGLLTEIALFLVMMSSKKYVSILRSFLLETTAISRKFLVSSLR